MASPCVGRSSQVSDAVIDKFEQRVRAVGLSEDVTYYFPMYGGWHIVPWDLGAPTSRDQHQGLGCSVGRGGSST